MKGSDQNEDTLVTSRDAIYASRLTRLDKLTQTSQSRHATIKSNGDTFEGFHLLRQLPYLYPCG